MEAVQNMGRMSCLFGTQTQMTMPELAEHMAACSAARRVAVAEGGALWRDVDAATQAHGLATPGGLISDTGVAGLTLSGGIGWLRAKHGLSIDNLVAADVVTAAGELAVAVDQPPLHRIAADALAQGVDPG